MAKAQKQTIQKSKHQKLEVVTIRRSQIKLAAYNPRKLSEKARIALRKNLKRIGLLETLVWNEVTGNLVSGHQRLTILDSLENYPEKDYSLDVAKVHLSDKEEKEQNIFMNSTSAQGDYDYDLLSKIITESELDPTEAGLSTDDLNIMGLEIERVFNVEESQEVEELSNIKPQPSYEERKAKVIEKKEIYKNKKEDEDSPDFMVVIVFPNSDAVQRWNTHWGLRPETKYIPVETIDAIIHGQRREED